MMGRAVFLLPRVGSGGPYRTLRSSWGRIIGAASWRRHRPSQCCAATPTQQPEIESRTTSKERL